MIKELLIVGALIGGLVTLGVKYNSSKKESRKAVQLQELREQNSWCHALASAAFNGAAAVILYQDQNRFLIRQDYDYSVNYAELRLDQQKNDCDNEYYEDLKELK